ncbi:MAG: cytochrome c biogenesis heme-transporting ATPase CcmA [Gammaproteobacteria bacterium]
MGGSHQDCLRATGLELWRGDRCLFRDLNLAVSAGELLHVTGANGSGKTSLLRVLTGLSRPEEGTVEWNERSIHRARQAFQLDMGYVAHHDGVYDDLTLSQNLQWGAGLHRDISPQTVREYLEEIGLGFALDVPAYALSAGQKRRLSLARVHLSQKRLWILDEPLANLDVEARQWCDDLIAQHVQNGGLVIATSHQALCGDRVTRRELEIVA